MITNTDPYVSVDFSRDGGPRLVDDGVDLLDDVKVGLVVGVLDAGATPGNVRQLTGRQGVADTETNHCKVSLTIEQR